MKRTQVLSLLIPLAGLLAVPVGGYGQVVFERSFNIAGIVNPGDQNLLGQLNATVNVKFIDLDANNLVNRLQVSVTNSGPATSQITGFFLLQPLLKTPYMPVGGLLSNSPDGGDPYLMRNNPGLPPSSAPDDWSMAVQLESSLAQFAGLNPNDERMRHYFGATYGTGLSVPTTGTFIFDFAEFSLNSSDWLSGFGDDALPNVIIRWQSVIVGNLTDASGKGLSDGAGFDPAVIPEPATVAGLSVLGLGVILLVRRRLVRKS